MPDLEDQNIDSLYGVHKMQEVQLCPLLFLPHTGIDKVYGNKQFAFAHLYMTQNYQQRGRSILQCPD